MFRDPAVRRAYVLTKVTIFAVATAVTWPLANVFGARAWWGLAAFGVVLLVITVTVLFAGRVGQDAKSGEDSESEPVTAPDQPVNVPVEDRIDLHAFAPRDIPHVVADYLDAAHARGFREVRLIHGRGIGVQRERVRSVLARHPLVEGYHDAPADRGGWGATVAYLQEPSEAS